ncbi:MAG TPA: lipoprotein insertase outer membrane protein LolB [Methylotenera sp.]
MNTFISLPQHTARPMPAMRVLCFLGLMSVFAGCVSVPATKTEPSTTAQALRAQHLQQLASIQQFSIQGRIGVQTNGKGFSGSLQWQHNNAEDIIDLYSPLGSQVASIKKTADQVTLTDSSGKSFSAADAETLTQQTLGWKLPLTGLSDWSIGRPTQSPIQSSSWNEQGLLTNLDQDGWKIEYDNYAQQDAYMLPGKIFLKSDKLNLKLLVEKWNSLEQ